MTSDDKVTYFGVTDSRNKQIKFGIKAKDRTRHFYVIGKTGMGKSTVLENMAVQDIQGGEGLCFIDPHGKSAELLLNYVPQERLKDVLFFAPFDVDHPIAFNVMEDVGYDKRHLVVSGLMSTFKKIWVDAWSARMEYILSNTLLALLEYPGATLLGVNKMYADKAYRKKVVDNISDPSVKSFWVDEFAKYTDKFAAEATPAIQNKIGQFTNNPLIRNIIGQPKSSFDIRKMMDERKIMIVNLSKGRVGESNANLLGAMLITKIYLAAMSRADVSEKVLQTLPQFYLYVDEFQSFANESFADILSEARKYKLNLTIAHQYIEQMSEEVRAAVFGNVGTMVVFRVGAYDAEVLEKEFAPQFTAEDIVNLGQFQMYLRLMIDGVGSQPFSARNLPPLALPAQSFREQLVESSRAQFGQLRSMVEEHVRVQTLGPSALAQETSAQKLQAQHTQPGQLPQTSKPAVANMIDPNIAKPAAQAQAPRPMQSNGVSNDRRAPDVGDRRGQDRDRRPSYGPQGQSMQRRDQQSNQRNDQPGGQNNQYPRRDHPAPPLDEADGFQGLAALKSMLPPRPGQNQQSNQQNQSNQSASRPPEKKGITPESRNDLKQALASIVGAPKPAAVAQQPAQAAQPKPAPQPAPKAESKIEAKPEQKSAPNEVPEDVLKKLLDV